jgi:hypothetical protein
LDGLALLLELLLRVSEEADEERAFEGEALRASEALLLRTPLELLVLTLRLLLFTAGGLAAVGETERVAVVMDLAWDRVAVARAGDDDGLLPPLFAVPLLASPLLPFLLL